MKLAGTLTRTLNTPEIQALIAQAWLTRDTSLVKLDELLTQRESAGASTGIIVFDVDKSAEVKRYGLAAKYELIRSVGTRVSALCLAGELLLPLGNDEFLIASDIGLRRHLESRADVLRRAVESEVFYLVVQDTTLSLSASISLGLTLVPEDSKTAPDAYQDGINGCYLAKDLGRNTFAWGRDLTRREVTIRSTERHLARLELLANDLGRSVDDVATEAFDSILRRYHRT
jgi:GGDEF domain-containing protein